jgi:hypothetical protein
MKKKSLITLGGIGGNFIIAYFGLSLFLGHIVKVGVNSFAPSLTQTQVGLKAARISPFSGSGSLTGLRLATLRDGAITTPLLSEKFTLRCNHSPSLATIS